MSNMRDSLTNRLADVVNEIIDDGVTVTDFINEARLCWNQHLEDRKKRDDEQFVRILKAE